ncbi:MAG: prepilin peptidase [SAR202 cluster bacterium]|nr:prepilin peptidase [SAR202 cluster bacterium]
MADAYLRAREGAGVAFGIMLVIYLLWRGGMGAGDVKLAAMVGAATGYPLAIFVLLMAFIAGGAVSLLLVGLRSKGWKEELPFGSFLAVVVMTGLMVKGDLYGWYLDLFGL